jgi:hypothetical protein
MLSEQERREMLDRLQEILGPVALGEKEGYALLLSLREWLDSCIIAASTVGYMRGQKSVISAGRRRA